MNTADSGEVRAVREHLQTLPGICHIERLDIRRGRLLADVVTHASREELPHIERATRASVMTRFSSLQKVKLRFSQDRIAHRRAITNNGG